jgi:predicted esterase YcpF (UPF0227 family)
MKPPPAWDDDNNDFDDDDEAMTTDNPPITHLLYLHGFRSSPASAKARQTLAWMRTHAPSVHCSCPQLPPSPAEAVELLHAEVARWRAQGATPNRIGLIGSSLGGFYATRMAQDIGCRAVLVNPAVDPARQLAEYIGELRSYHGDDVFFFRPEHVAQLRMLHAGPLQRPRQLLVFVAEGDEVLDPKEMATRYAQTRLRLLPGGDHALSDYPDHLPEVMRFMGLGADGA